MAVEGAEVNAAAWVKMLRGVWLARPSLAGARAVVSMCRNMLETMLVRSKAMDDDRFTRQSLKTWHADFQRAVARLDLAHAGASLAFLETQPGSVDRVSMLTAHTMGPILDGVFPVGYCEATKPEGVTLEELCKGLAKRVDGTWKGMGIAFDVASLWNRLAAAQTAAEQQSGLVPDFVAEWLTQAEHQLGESAPGEDPTIIEEIGSALEAAKEKVADIAKAIGTRVLIWGAVGVGVVLGAYLLFRK